MDIKAALRWTAFYKGIAWVSGLVGLAFVYGGLYLTIGGLPLSSEGFFDAASEPVFLALALLGFLVWQAGKTVAFYKTLTEATEEEMAERFDVELLKSDILSVLDERLAEMQTQIEGTRRSVEELDSGAAGEAATGGFDFED